MPKARAHAESSSTPRGLGAARPLDFSDLTGWADDDHRAAFDVFRRSAAKGLALPDNPDRQAARLFFERSFAPVCLDGGAAALITGYYEPELAGSRAPDAAFPVPLYGAPPNLPADRPWATRAEIEDQGLLTGRALELAWVAHEIDRFLLQVQGSGRIRFADGACLRLGYGGRNGHPYRSIGQELIRRGDVPQAEMSAQRLRSYLLANPEKGRALLRHNPSYVFFRALQDLPEDLGPIGTMGHPLTPLRSLAVDPEHTPLGLPVWLESQGAAPVRRLTIAQDTGSAIKGPGRADVFIGTGEEAGQVAGQMRDPGRLVVLVPREGGRAGGVAAGRTR